MTLTMIQEALGKKKNKLEPSGPIVHIGFTHIQRGQEWRRGTWGARSAGSHGPVAEGSSPTIADLHLSGCQILPYTREKAKENRSFAKLRLTELKN